MLYRLNNWECWYHLLSVRNRVENAGNAFCLFVLMGADLFLIWDIHMVMLFRELDTRGLTKSEVLHI